MTAITPEDLRRRVEAGEHFGDIARSLGVPRADIVTTCAVLGIKRPRKAKPVKLPWPPTKSTRYGVDSSELLRAMATFGRG